MKKNIPNPNVREFLMLAKRITAFLTEEEFNEVLKIYDKAISRLESEDK